MPHIYRKKSNGLLYTIKDWKGYCSMSQVGLHCEPYPFIRHKYSSWAGKSISLPAGCRVEDEFDVVAELTTLDYVG